MVEEPVAAASAATSRQPPRSVPKPPPPPPPSLLPYARGVVRAEGVRALYRGVGLVLAGTIPGSALFYAG